MIHIKEHQSESYAPRTYANAASASVTAAFALDFHTAGEKLTKKAAGYKYIALPLQQEMDEVSPTQNAVALLAFCRKKKAHSINVAGNGIYTTSRFGWDQGRLNAYVFQVLSTVYQQHPLQHVYCGGQTGLDIAGAVAAEALGIAVTIHMPKGLKQRLETGEDVARDPREIYEEVKAMARFLHRRLSP